MNTALLFGIAVVPAVIGLTQVFKLAGLPSRFAPAIAICFGIAAALAEQYQAQLPWVQAVVVGVALGLSAVGLYSTGATWIRAGQNGTAGAASFTTPAIQALPPSSAVLSQPTQSQVASNAAGAPISSEIAPPAGPTPS
ncbi:MAG TPA: hypothetical protein VKX16_10395 [Chloroflexota bacterium]|nr:hypothetical protein [Chloroflexota bacterium]